MVYVENEYCSPHPPIGQEFPQWAPTIQQVIESGIPQVDDIDLTPTTTIKGIFPGEWFVRRVYGDHIPDNISVHALRQCNIIIARDESEAGDDWTFYAYDPKLHGPKQDIRSYNLTPAQAEEIFAGLGTSETPLNVKIASVRKQGCSLLLQLIAQPSQAA